MDSRFIAFVLIGLAYSLLVFRMGYLEGYIHGTDNFLKRITSKVEAQIIKTTKDNDGRQ